MAVASKALSKAMATSTAPGDSVGPHDVLCGRGGLTNHNPGNIAFRVIVNSYREPYLKAKKLEKSVIAHNIIAAVKKQGGRFLMRSKDGVGWTEVPEKKAQQKTSQALREGLDVRKKLYAANGDPPAAASMPVPTMPVAVPTTSPAIPIASPHISLVLAPTSAAASAIKKRPTAVVSPPTAAITAPPSNGNGEHKIKKLKTEIVSSPGMPSHQFEDPPEKNLQPPKPMAKTTAEV